MRSLDSLDSARAFLLSRTLRLPFVRSTYARREARTLVLFALACGFNLLLLRAAPEALFYGAPLVLGVPHLIASFWWTDASMEKKVGVRPVLVATLAAFGLWWGRNESGLADPYHLATTTPLALACAFVVFRNRRFAPLLAFSVGAASLWNYPYETALFLLFGHNLVAFIFWYRAARGTAQKRSVFVATGIAFASLWAIAPVTASTDALALYTQLLFGVSPTPLAVWLTGVFLFTQSLHYFVWLKAIPDFRSSSETPGGFRLTFERVRSDLGRAAPHVCLALILVLAWIAFERDWEQSRRFYVAIAGFHGFFEIAALGAFSRRG